IVVKEFIAGLDVAYRINENAVVFLDRFAVGIARVIDPACVVTANFWIDYIAVFQSEVKGVWIIVIVRGGFPCDAFSGVLNNACAFGNELRSVNATAVHAGFANFNLHGLPPNSSFLRHTRSRSYVLVLNSWL